MKNRKRRTPTLRRLLLSVLLLAVLTVICSAQAAEIVTSILPDAGQADPHSRIALTEQEQDFLSEHPSITVAGDASWRPLEYRDDQTGQYTGVIAGILERLAKHTGVRIDVKLYDSYVGALQAVQAGEADVISGLAFDSATAKRYGVMLSAPYLTINSAIVSAQNNFDLYSGTDTKRIAVVEGDYENDQIQSHIANAELLPCSSNKDCLDLVKNGQADLAIIASYCAEYYISIPKYSDLRSHTISDFSWPLCFGVRYDASPIMLSILNKGIRAVEELDINEAVYHGVVDAAYDNDFLLFIYRHPLLVICVTVAIVLLIGVLLLVIYQSKKRAQLRQLEDGARLQLALARTHLCIWELDLSSHRITQVDNAHEKHGFYHLRENIPESAIAAGYVHPDDVPLVREAFARVMRGDPDVQGCWRIKGTGETAYWWEQILFQLVYDDRKRPFKAIGVSEDVTREKDAQRDSLTLVYNRSSFEQQTTLALHEQRNSHPHCAFLILDLDHFKQINDTYGHDAGDRVLISVGTTLNQTFRTTDIVGRLGGDEFTVFMPTIRCAEDAAKKAQQLVEAISRLRRKENYPFLISCSVGIVVAAKDHEAFATLYKKADTALYEAKRRGRNQFFLYEP